MNDPKKFRIPKEFTLFGHKYSVVLEDDLFSKQDCYGMADDDTKIINIQKCGNFVKIRTGDLENKSAVEVKVTDEVMIETFYHELIHIILYALGEDDLSEKEKFVNMLGKAMLEIYLSSKYEEEK